MNLTEVLRQYKEYGVYKLTYPTLEYIINELLKQNQELLAEHDKHKYHYCECELEDNECNCEDKEPQYDRNDLD